MLSLLTSLLADGSSEEVVSRGELYVRAIDQLLHKSSSLKWARQRDMDSRSNEEKIKLLADPRCFDFLRCLAYRTHERRVRDITPSALFV